MENIKIMKNMKNMKNINIMKNMRNMKITKNIKIMKKQRKLVSGVLSRVFSLWILSLASSAMGLQPKVTNISQKFSVRSLQTGIFIQDV